MKKFFKMFFCMLVGLCLVSCNKESHEPKTFIRSGVTITLTDEFVYTEVVQAPICYQTKDVIFTANKELKSDLGDDLFLFNSPTNYANLVIEANNLKCDDKKAESAKSLPTANDGYYAYTIYDKTVSGRDFRYLLVCMVGINYAYCMNFATLKSNFDNYLDQFHEYAKTLEVN